MWTGSEINSEDIPGSGFAGILKSCAGSADQIQDWHMIFTECSIKNNSLDGGEFEPLYPNAGVIIYRYFLDASALR